MCFDFETEFRFDIKADYVFIAQVLLYINDIELILSKLYEVLNPRGPLLIVDFDKNEKVISDKGYNGFDQEELIILMTKIGFKEKLYKGVYRP